MSRWLAENGRQKAAGSRQRQQIHATINGGRRQMIRMMITMLLLFTLLCTFQAVTVVTDEIPSSDHDGAIHFAKKVAVRVVGGEITDIRKYPFLVSVQRRHISHSCGGTYIAPRFVLSAAHCMVRQTFRGNWIVESPRRFYAIAGATYVYFPTWSSIQMELIDGTFPHTNFRFSNMHHDIGLFRLQKPFYINSYVKYITLPLAYDANIFQKYTDPCTVVGWGQHIPGSNEGVGTYLRRVHVPLIPTEKCTVKGVDPKWHLCAGALEGGRDSCQGDSGGPLICNDIQIGIVSWGAKNCARPQSPGVYCRLDLYLDWLNRTIEKNNASINICDITSMFVLLIYILYCK